MLPAAYHFSRSAANEQLELFSTKAERRRSAPSSSLLKWIGNKCRFAEEIVSYFPPHFRGYFEPFLGSGAVLATLAPDEALGSDSFKPVVDFWFALNVAPSMVVEWYRDRWERMKAGDKRIVYEEIKASYNESSNAADLLFLSRSCYGGVVRFRKSDGYISTPCGIHNPIDPDKFAKRVFEWRARVKHATFECFDFQEALERTREGDLVYCDPPYSDSQPILYGAQGFDLQSLFAAIDRCRVKGCYVALSIDGTKRSGEHSVELDVPKGLFKREIRIRVGHSMLKRFQMNGRTMEKEVVHDRLLLTY